MLDENTFSFGHLGTNHRTFMHKNKFQSKHFNKQLVFHQSEHVLANSQHKYPYQRRKISLPLNLALSWNNTLIIEYLWTNRVELQNSLIFKVTPTISGVNFQLHSNCLPCCQVSHDSYLLIYVLIFSLSWIDLVSAKSPPIIC